MIIPKTPSDPSSSTHTTSHRIKRGTKLADIPSVDPVPPLSALNGPFQLAEYLALRIKADPHDVKTLVDVPKGDGHTGGTAPERNVWIYEHLRRLPIDLTTLINALLPICSKESCPEMKAEQWLYFCSAHPETAECCALDYILHTVDSTSALLNSPRQFPSRILIPTSSLSHFPSLFRRLSRIFSHAFFHHREAFSLSEMETSLYARFVALCERYDLVGSNLLVIPRDALSTISQNNADSEEEDDEEDEEEEEEDSDEESDQAVRGRGEKGDNREKRTRSLDRHGPPDTFDVSVAPVQPKLLSRDTVTPSNSSPLKAGSTTSNSNNLSPGNDDPFRSSPRSATTRGTLGRGKQPRGTMLWTTDTPNVPDLPIGPMLSRTESNQTAILIEEELGQEVSDTTTSEETVEEGAELPVPKDEIELLEEEGVIPPAESVSPLPSPSQDEVESEETKLVEPVATEQEKGSDEVQEESSKDLIEEGSAEGETEGSAA